MSAPTTGYGSPEGSGPYGGRSAEISADGLYSASGVYPPSPTRKLPEAIRRVPEVICGRGDYRTEAASGATAEAE